MFVGRRAQAVVFAIFAAICAVTLCLGFATWLSLGVGNPAKRVVHSLSESEAFRDEAARFFVEKLSEDAGSDVAAAGTWNDVFGIEPPKLVEANGGEVTDLKR